MADYRVTVVEEPWVDRGGWVTFSCVIERPDNGGWVAVHGAATMLRIPVAEVRGALQAGNPLAALAALVVSYAQEDEGVVMDSKIAPYRASMPSFPVTLNFSV